MNAEVSIAELVELCSVDDQPVHLPLGGRYTGRYALVDRRDMDRFSLQNYSWYVMGNGYVQAESTILLHRLVTGASRGFDVDHKNHNLLDNRQCNLRVVSHRQNMQNMILLGGSSQFRGVSFNKRLQKWHAYYRDNRGKRVHVGFFSNEYSAAAAYNKAIQKSGRTNPILNIVAVS